MHDEERCDEEETERSGEYGTHDDEPQSRARIRPLIRLFTVLARMLRVRPS